MNVYTLAYQLACAQFCFSTFAPLMTRCLGNAATHAGLCPLHVN